jgi:RND family efflux transporter MFP subunit
VSSKEASTSGRDPLASLRIERTAVRVEHKKRRGWIWLLMLAALAGAGYAAVRFNQKSELPLQDRLSKSGWMPEIMQQRTEVRLKGVEVQRGRSADAVVVATGYVESRRQARIGARSPGRINSVTFEEGDRITSGDLLAELDHKDLDASLAASAASVARAKAALAEQEIVIKQSEADESRAQKLRNTSAISESEYDQLYFSLQSARARRESLKAELLLSEAQHQQAEQMLENMFIRAPFDGTIISKDAEEGESIMPGGMGGTSGRGSVATIADLDQLDVVCDVQEGFISRVSEQQKAEISIDSVPDKKYHGFVRKVIPMGDRARATIKVQVQIEDVDALLFPEMSGTVFFLPNAQDLQVDDKPRYFCPTSAIDCDPQGDCVVWVVDADKHAKQIKVKVGPDRDGRSEILEGVTGGERVIVNPTELQDGMLVTVVE